MIARSLNDAITCHSLCMSAYTNGVVVKDFVIRPPSSSSENPCTSDRGGEPLEANNLKKRYFKPILEAAGLPDMRLYDLRHTAATLRLVNGEHPKVVQEMLGHASITLTLDTYSHVLPGMQEESAARLNALLTGTP